MLANVVFGQGAKHLDWYKWYELEHSVQTEVLLHLSQLAGQSLKDKEINIRKKFTFTFSSRGGYCPYRACRKAFGLVHEV